MIDTTWHNGPHDFKADLRAARDRMVADCFRMVERFKAEDAARKRRTAEVCDRMEPCRTCGHRIRFVEGPPEGIAVCRHVENSFRAFAQPDVSRSPGPGLFGWVIYREEAEIDAAAMCQREAD